MPELRKDPIMDRWVIISTERAKRPSDLALEKARVHGGFCPLCPGNEDKTPPEIMALREDGSSPDTPGWKLRVVPNKFPALVTSGQTEIRSEGLYEKMDGFGAHEIIIETPRHDLTALTMSTNDFANLLLTYRQRVSELLQDARFQYVAVFKNYGEVAGASLEHPHSQLIALPVVPKRALEKLNGSRRYFARAGRCAVCDMIRQELSDGRRLIFQNDDYLAFTPFASRFPFETWLVPRRHEPAFELTAHEHFGAMAEAMSIVLKKICQALNTPPYNYMLHTVPCVDSANTVYHWHFEIIPRLTRVAGFEWGSGFYINPTPPEQAARFLRDTQVT